MDGIEFHGFERTRPVVLRGRKFTAVEYTNGEYILLEDTGSAFPYAIVRNGAYHVGYVQLRTHEGRDGFPDVSVSFRHELSKLGTEWGIISDYESGYRGTKESLQPAV